MSEGLVMSLVGYEPQDFVDCGALAKIMRVCPRTLRRMVLRYELPQGIRQGKRKLWRVGALMEWYRRREDENMNQAERERERIRRYEEGA